MQGLPENHFRVSGVSWVNINNYYNYNYNYFSLFDRIFGSLIVSVHTYIQLYSKILKRRVWRLTLYINSPEKIKVKRVKLCTENFQKEKKKKGKVSVFNFSFQNLINNNCIVRDKGFNGRYRPSIKRTNGNSWHRGVIARVSLLKGDDFDGAKFSSKMFLMFIFVCYVHRPV